MSGYEARKQRTSGAILAAAVELFSKQGINKTSITEIAAAAGVNPVSVYNRFENKARLVREALLTLVQEQWEASRSIIQGSGSFLERLEGLIAFKRAQASRRNAELLQAAASAEPGLAREIGEYFATTVNPAVEAFFAEGRAEGAIRKDLSPEVLGAYLDMFYDLARKHPELFAGEEAAQRASREIWGLLLDGLRG